MTRLPHDKRLDGPPEECTKDGATCEACDGSGGDEMAQTACWDCRGTGKIESTEDCQCDDCQQERRDDRDRRDQESLEDAHARGLIRED